MGSTHTTNATARTTITLAEGIDMSKLLEELTAEYLSGKPPDDAVTVKQFAEAIGETQPVAREYLDKKVKKENWKTISFKGSNYYWKPAD